MNISASVVTVIMKQMPSGAEKYLTQLGDGGFKLSIHWKLPQDTEKPIKYSKAIVIDVHRELIKFLSDSPDHIRQATLQKIGSFVSSKLSTFDPDHNSPRGALKPRENWSLSIEHLSA